MYEGKARLLVKEWLILLLHAYNAITDTSNANENSLI